jgi:hypothetical protein
LPYAIKREKVSGGFSREDSVFTDSIEIALHVFGQNRKTDERQNAETL